MIKTIIKRKGIIYLISFVMLSLSFVLGYYLGTFIVNKDYNNLMVSVKNPKILNENNGDVSMENVKILIVSRKVYFNEAQGGAEYSEKKISETNSKDYNVQKFTKAEFKSKCDDDGYNMIWDDNENVRLIRNSYEDGLFVLKSDDGAHIKIYETKNNLLTFTKEYANRNVKDIDDSNKEALNEGIMVYKTISDAKGLGGN